MLKNYFKVALRNLTRNKIFSIINIFGLAIGLTTCLLILTYIVSESGYDQQNKDANLIYRLGGVGRLSKDKEERGWAAAPAPLAWAVKADMPEIAQSTRLLKFPMVDKFLLTVKTGKDQNQFYEPNGYYIDSTFFQVFTYDFQYGSPATSLLHPNSIILSEVLAKKLFGGENPLGHSISIGLPFGNFDYTVSGVFRTPAKSHIPAHFFLSMRNKDVGTWVASVTNWATNSIFHTYIRLGSATDIPALQRKINADIDKKAGDDLKAFGVGQRTFILQPITRIYLHSKYDYEVAPVGNITTLYILGSIAVFVLLIACINFMNLSTARSTGRAKEVGVRKVLGAEKRLLVAQFLGESVLMSSLALLLAIAFTSMLLPAFGTLVQKQLQLFNEPIIWVGVITLTIGTGIVSGLYPAFYLSAFRPINVLKGKLLHNFSAGAIRKGLIVFQFTISIGLVSGAIIIARQLNYLESRSLGFKKDQQLVLPLQSQLAQDNFIPLKNELGKLPAVRAVTGGSSYPGISNINDLLFYGEGKTVRDVIDIALLAPDDDYCKTLGLTLLYGREFTKASTADSNSIILNETALQQLGYSPSSAVGRRIYYDFQGQHVTMQIVGVIKDFNFESLYNPIKPLALVTRMTPSRHTYLIANVNSTGYASLLAEVEAAWKRINPNQPFVYSFLDKDFQANYEKDQRASRVVGYFTIVTILIACLGLFGLSVFAAEQRIREIGIRKVLGASVSNITLLLSRDFLGLVALAIVISTPLAWYAMHRWLENFAYQTTISWWLFPLSGVIAIAIAWLTVSFQAIRTALTNPTKSLRSE